jgi:hypothetical protein
MKIGEDIFCFFYMFLSSIGVLYQLRNQSIVTVQCENSTTYCLKHVSYESGFRHTFTAKDLEFRCNTEGFSVWLRFLAFLGVFSELVVYGGAVYVYYYKPKIIGVDLRIIFQRCIIATASITGLLMILFILFPSASYILPSGGAGERGIIAEVWASPLRGLVLLVLNIITAPLRWIFHNRFKTELGLDKLYTNYSCVEPESGLLRCPMELQIFPNMPGLLNCESDFFCARECSVVFPQIVINSLAFIFASLALFYRLLKLTHYITERETGLDLIATNIGSNNTVNGEKEFEDISSNVDESSGNMKEKSVGRSTKPKTAALKRGEKDVYPRRNAVRKRGEIQQNTLQPKAISQKSDRTQPQRKTDSQTDKFTENRSVTAENSDVFDSETHLDRTTEITANDLELFELEDTNLDRANGITPACSKIFHLEEANLDSLSEQNYLANGTCEERKPKLASTSKKRRAGFTGETIYDKNGKALTNGANHSQHKTQGQTTRNLRGKSTRPSISNGHLRKEANVHRRTAQIQNGVSEVGLTGSYNDNDGYEEPEWSSSEDIVEGIEGLLVVEDESEFYMSGFRL